MADNSNFFESQTPTSLIKASIVSEYFPKYCKIIVRKRIPRMIRYIDLFAGPGMYQDGSPSTPLMIAKNCYDDPQLRNQVWMIFNDKLYSEELKANFEVQYPVGTFLHKPFFGNQVVGESEGINRYIAKNTLNGNYNDAPAVMFIDPFGYKNIDTRLLAQFLSYWGNELFIFVNSKRINAAIDNDKFEENMRTLFPTQFDALKNQIRSFGTLSERLQFIIDNLGQEYNNLLRGRVFYTAFKFQEEAQDTTSHYILHLTKGPRGYDLIKQIYNDFANVGTIFDGRNTYTFDQKMIGQQIIDIFDPAQDNIDKLAGELCIRFAGRTLTAYDLFEQDQTGTLYSRAHYTKALRQLYDAGKISSVFTDGKNHTVSVLLNRDCTIKFL